MSRIALLLLGSTLALASQARASDKALEITPVLGFRGGAELEPESVGEPNTEAGASLTFGVVADFKVRPDARVEFFFDRQKLEFEGESTSFDLVVDYLQAGGVYEPHPDGTRPFVGVALGLSHVDGKAGATVDDSLGISGSIGGGVKVPLGSRLALRLELRGYATFSDSTFQAVCGPGCTVSFSSGGWYQLAARAGLAIRIGS